MSPLRLGQTKAEEACATVSQTDVRHPAGHAAWQIIKLGRLAGLGCVRESRHSHPLPAHRSPAPRVGIFLRVLDDVAGDKLLMAT